MCGVPERFLPKTQKRNDHGKDDKVLGKIEKNRIFQEQADKIEQATESQMVLGVTLKYNAAKGAVWVNVYTASAP